MQIRDLIPWSRNRQGATPPATQANNPLQDLQRDINRVFDDFWSRFDRPFAQSNGFGIGLPRTDVSETDSAIEVSVDLPGLEQKDIDVNLTDDVLTIHAERKSESEENRRGVYMSERTYGSFHRMLPIPPGVDPEKAEAKFRNGVLTVTLPKTPEARAKMKRIDVKAA